MNYTIENEILKVTVSDLGAELVSVKDKAGCEYIWQGDSRYWSGHAPVLFPICCRLYGGYYTYEGCQYTMGGHGFARRTVFDSVKASSDAIKLTLSSEKNPKLQEQYPFCFAFTVTYKLTGKKLAISFEVENTDTKKDLIFALGGHPGFNLPLDKGKFEDWYLEFDKEAEPKQIIFSDTCFQTGKRIPYVLENGKTIRLKHNLFDNDAIFLADACRGVTLKSDKSDRSVHINCPKMSYLGIWHTPKADAPFVCIEPMNGLPSFDGTVDCLNTKSDTVKLDAGKKYKSGYDITFN